MKPHEVLIKDSNSRALAVYDAETCPFGWVVSFRPATASERIAIFQPVQPKDYAEEMAA